jgi:hypothetical protein
MKETLTAEKVRYFRQGERTVGRSQAIQGRLSVLGNVESMQVGS